MNDTNRKVILIPIITALVSGIGSATIISLFQGQHLQNQIDELRIQNKILDETLLDQKEQTVIMNATLQNLVQSLEKKSLISVKVLPHVESLYNPIDVGSKITFGEKLEREIFFFKTPIPLKANQTIIFDIIITNVGSDTAVLNKYEVEIIAKYKSGHFSQTYNNDIREILEANSKPKIIPFELKVEPEYSPQGEIFFTVVHDNGASESYSLQYFYDD